MSITKQFKHLFITTISLLFLVLMFTSCNKSRKVDLSWPVATKMSKPWTRWWWLGNAVDTTGLRYNLRQMHQAGIGGTELSLIYGTKGYENQFIKFLSPKWMQMYGYTVSESKKLNMGVDLTGGTGWPFGGPNVSIQNAACRAIFQKYHLKGGQSLQKPVVVQKKHQRGKAPLQALMAYSDKGKTINLTNKVQPNGDLNWTAPAGNWTLIAVFNGKTLQKVKRAAPGGKGWVMDPFSKKALSDYLKRFTKAFKSSKSPSPQAFFCDSYEVFGADWSPDFFNEFYKLRGYHLQDYLPQLLGNGKKDTVKRVRQDYRQTLSDMLLNNFVIPWNKWAHQMGSKTRYQAHGSPGNLLDLYAVANIPETETTGHTTFMINGTKVHSGNSFFMKFASSAAHIRGRKYASSETFTWMMEHFRFRPSVAKPILDQLFLSGINHVVYQGTPYSPKGAPWPGWQFYASVDLSPYNPIWPDMKGFDQYITRSQSFLQSGKPDNDFLLYWPAQDLWYNLKGPLAYQLSSGNTGKWLQPTPFYNAAKRIKQDGYSLDYISGRYLQRTTVKKGLLQTPGARYKALVVPPCRFMSVGTLQAVLRLIQHGGKVIFLDHLPKNVPGLGNLAQRRQQYKKLVQKFPEGLSFNNNKKQRLGSGELITGSDLKKTMSLTGVPAEAMVEEGLKYERRKLPDGTAYFIKNPHTHKTVDGWVPLSVPATSAAIYAPYSGKKGVAKTRSANGHTQVYLQLHPGQALIVRTWSHKNISGNPWSYYKKKARPVKIGGPWQFSFGQGWPSIPGHFRMHQLHSWTSLNDSARTFAGTGIYETHFKEPTTKAGNWLLKLGKVNYGAKVFLNGHKVGTLWALPFEARVGAYLKKGENTLKIEVSNSGANRIAQYDRTGRKWKKFYDINFVNMNYKPFDASGWKTVSSGLLGPVTLTPLVNKKF
ncbi:MAG TPA: glycosyl hydrolase [Balneolaceae bacterium]|nr:glycosyl hydrolase [Balneolaceae bacterium]